MDLIRTYVEFKTKSFLDTIHFLTDEFDTDFATFVLKEYIDTYIQTYYFHSLQTLENDDVKKYDLSTIVKEFDGKKLEIKFELENKSEDNEIIIDKAYKYVLACVKMEFNDYELSVYDSILRNIESNRTSEEVIEFYKKIKFKEEKFLSELEFDYFGLNYNNYKGKNDKYFVELISNIKQLDTYYSKTSINKNFNKSSLAYDKLKTLMGLLSADLLRKIVVSETVGYYFVPVASVLLDDYRLANIFNMMTVPYIREHIVFVINYNDYVNHKKILNYFDVNYSLAANVDMSHINDIENKIENVENIKMFDYILLDKVKQKDYEAVLKYDTLTGKEIFINELERM